MNAAQIITVCEGPKKPILYEIRVVGLETFSPFVKEIGNLIQGDFDARGYLSSQIGYSAMTDVGTDKIYSCEEGESSSEHEKFHVAMQRAGLTDRFFSEKTAKSYFSIFSESAPESVGEYALLASADQKELVSSSVNYKRNFGNKVYDLVQRTLDLEDIAEEEVAGCIKKSFPHHEQKNWASLMVDLQYFGMLDPCYRILEKYGLEDGKNKLLELGQLLKSDQTAQTFMQQLRMDSGMEIKDMKPIRDDNMRLLLQYRSDDGDLLTIKFNGPSANDGEEDKCGFFKEIRGELLSKYKPELDKLGQLCLNITANRIIFGS